MMEILCAFCEEELARGDFEFNDIDDPDYTITCRKCGDRVEIRGVIIRDV